MYRPFPRNAGIWILLQILALLCAAPAIAQKPWPLWEAYTRKFLDPQGRVIDYSHDGRTTSEGQAYAMFFALVDNDRPQFDKLLAWTEANLAGGDLTSRLPAWNWGRSANGEWKTLDPNPAADADLWLAYSLIEAGRLWHQPRYSKLGLLIAARIAREEVVVIPKLGTTLLPGPQGFHPEPNAWLLNPSYLPPPLLARLSKADPHGPWSAILQSLPAVIGQQHASGYAMDWLLASASGLKPAPGPGTTASGNPQSQPLGSYDAIRVYLWLGVSDPATPTVRDLLQQLPAMANFLRSNLTPPLQIDATGHILRPDSPPGFSAAVAPYLLASRLPAQARTQLDRLAATQSPASGLYGPAGEYFDQNLALFSTAFLQHRYRFQRDGTMNLMWK